MPLVPIARLALGLLSLVILVLAGYLLITWRQGETAVDIDGALWVVREDWRLWTGAALLAWSFAGRWLVTPLLTTRDRDLTQAVRRDGQMTAGANGSNLYVEHHGPEDGPVVILTHGWGLDSTIWSYARRDLSSRFHLIIWDLPGLGRSRLAGTLNLDVLAENLRSILSQAGGRPVVLVGHSIGGMAIQTLARDHPELFGREVAGVVLINTTHTNPLQTMILSPLMLSLRAPLLEPLMRLAVWFQPLAWAGAWQGYLSGSAHIANRLGFGPTVTRSQLEHTTLLATRNPPGVLARGNLAMFGWDSGRGLAHLTAPTLVLAGALDIVTRPDASRWITEAAPDARLEVIEGANHMGFLEQADLYNAAIERFVDGLMDHGGRAPDGEGPAAPRPPI